MHLCHEVLCGFDIRVRNIIRELLAVEIDDGLAGGLHHCLTEPAGNAVALGGAVTVGNELLHHLHERIPVPLILLVELIGIVETVLIAHLAGIGDEQRVGDRIGNDVVLTVVLIHINGIAHTVPDLVIEVDVIIEWLVLLLVNAVRERIPLVGEHIHRVTAEDAVGQRIELILRGALDPLHLAAELILEQGQGNGAVVIIGRIEVIGREPIDRLTAEIDLLVIVNLCLCDGDLVCLLIVAAGLDSTVRAAGTACCGQEHGQAQKPCKHACHFLHNHHLLSLLITRANYGYHTYYNVFLGKCQ